ncbi:Ig-like domain-containing protein [Parashewanella tropica]|uniref:Ig-like domain-containing protein n=1 Tax=Parashewanella tropica TaxID=2547970 RepID=UPI00105A5696|nr:Ig-like domain-containing protein [Parashewanella tropica]
MKGFSKYLISLASLLVLAGCGGSDNKDDPAPEPQPKVVKLVISDHKDVLSKGTSDQLALTASYDNDTTQDVTSDADWTSSNPDVVSVSGTGLLSAVDNGIADITASLSGVTTEKVTITVSDASLSSISLSVNRSDTAVNEKSQVSAMGTFSNNTKIALVNGVTWKSSDDAIFTINNSGELTGVAVGTANITATFDGVTSDPLSHEIVADEATSIYISKSTTSMEKGENFQFATSAKFRVQADEVVSVEWASSNINVATVSNSGLVQATAVGETKISASRDDFNAEPITVTVVEAGNDLVSIEITPDKDVSSLKVGEKVTFTAEGTYEDDSKANLDVNSVTWQENTEGQFAQWETNGVLRGVAAGFSEVRAQYDGKSSDLVKVTFVAPSIVGIDIDDDTPTSIWKVGDTVQLNVFSINSNQDKEDITNSTNLIWASENPNAATVTNGGLVEFLDAGDVKITVTLDNHTDDITFTISPKE